MQITHAEILSISTGYANDQDNVGEEIPTVFITVRIGKDVSSVNLAITNPERLKDLPQIMDDSDALKSIM